MPTYRIKDNKSGKTFVLKGDSPPTEQELVSIFDSMGGSGTDQKSEEGEKGLIRKGWDALAIPEQMSREGLGKLADMVPEGEMSGNMAADIARGTPKVIAETLAEAAPSFISRGSLLTAGALRGVKAAAPLAKMAGRQIAKAAEGISGLEYKTPGILEEAAKDSKLIFAPGKESAGKKFAEFMDKTKIRKSFGRATSPKELIDDAMKAFDEGTLTPQEAVIARQTLDGVKKTLPRHSYNEMRAQFDSIAKTISKEADAAFSRGVKADALRNVFPQNKLGGSSIAKGILGFLGGVAPSMAMSPLVQGSVATGAGVISRLLPSSPIPVGTTIGALADLIRRNSKED